MGKFLAITEDRIATVENGQVVDIYDPDESLGDVLSGSAKPVQTDVDSRVDTTLFKAVQRNEEVKLTTNANRATVSADSTAEDVVSQF